MEDPEITFTVSFANGAINVENFDIQRYGVDELESAILVDNFIAFCRQKMVHDINVPSCRSDNDFLLRVVESTLKVLPMGDYVYPVTVAERIKSMRVRCSYTKAGLKVTDVYPHISEPIRFSTLIELSREFGIDGLAVSPTSDIELKFAMYIVDRLQNHNFAYDGRKYPDEYITVSIAKGTGEIKEDCVKLDMVLRQSLKTRIIANLGGLYLKLFNKGNN